MTDRINITYEGRCTISVPGGLRIISKCDFDYGIIFTLGSETGSVFASSTRPSPTELARDAPKSSPNSQLSASHYTKRLITASMSPSQQSALSGTASRLAASACATGW